MLVSLNVAIGDEFHDSISELDAIEVWK